MAWLALAAGLWCASAGLFLPSVGFAQTGVVRRPVDLSAADRSGGTLEVPPRISASPPIPADSAPAAEPSVPADTVGEEPRDLSGANAASSDPARIDAAAANLPYLGISVQYIVSNDPPGHEVRGLEVVGVDPASPAEQAGLRGRGQLTKLGASGATAGALMAPLDLIIMPLLKRAGDLGADGDLIIAIDDNRVEAENDLKIALAGVKPGDVIYFTLVRQHQRGLHETLKLPVRLAAPRLPPATSQ